MQGLLLLGDLVAALLAVASSLALAGVLPGDLHRATGLCFLMLAPCWLTSLFMGRLYTLRPPRNPLVWAQQISYRTLQGSVLGIGLTFLVGPALLVGRTVYVLAAVIASLLFWIIRLIAVRYGPSPVVRERVLVVGTGTRCHSLMDALNNGRNPNRAHLIGAIRAGQDDGREDELPCALLGELSDCMDVIAREAVNHVVIAPAPPFTRDLTELAAHCGALGARVQTMEAAYEELTLRAPVFHVGEAWIASFDNANSNKYASRLKRVVDLAVTVATLPLALLCLGVCALLVKLTSPGPVFYHQERIGKDGVPFTITKLRTMVVDAEKLTGPVWAGKDDPRITPVGRFLRKSHLDEMPQILSVLTGDMSLIGPRPERPKFVEQLKLEIPLYDKRHVVRPGLTGWRQVNHYYDNSTEDSIESLRYDLYYIRHMSFSLDLLVILRTFGVIFGMKGQ